MKKLLILMLVLGLASTANAVLVTFDAPAEPGCGHGYDRDVLPGALVVVEITADTAVAAGYLVSITESADAENASAGMADATGVGALHVGFDNAAVNNTGILRNRLTNLNAPQRYMLIDRIVGGVVGGSPAIAAGQVLYSFEVLVPEDAEFCDNWTITAAIGFGAVSPPPAGYAHTLDATGQVPSVAVTLHAIPEPATIALLGLGSLFLMRRRRK